LNDSAIVRFFGVVRRPETWLGILFNWLAFPLGLFYFVFLVTGLSLGVGLVVVWVGIPILLVVAGAWWLFGAFERVQARYLLRADVPPAPREWEQAEGIWGKLKAHFGSAATWKDLVYLLAKLPFGIVSTTLLVTAAAMVFWFVAMPFFSLFDVPIINGTWVPPLWFGLVCLPLGILVFFVALHVINGWSWVCARWAEVMFRGPRTGAPVRLAPQPPAAPAPPVPPVPPVPAAALGASAAAPVGTAEPAGEPSVPSAAAGDAPASPAPAAPVEDETTS
jgi:hypothetical protein